MADAFRMDNSSSDTASWKIVLTNMLWDLRHRISVWQSNNLEKKVSVHVEEK